MSQHATDPEVLWGHDDDHTARLLTEHLGQHPGAGVTVLFEDDQVAQLWEGRPGVTARAWAPTLVRDVLTAFPPQPLERVAPPPVVVGDSALARRLVEAITAGWSGGAEAVTVHCVGGDALWAQEAAASARHAEVTWLSAPLQPASVVAAVSSLVDQWQRPQPNRGTPTGPTIYVVAAPESQALAAARAVAAEVPDARVVVVLSGEITWPRPDGVGVFTVAEVRDRLSREPEDPTARLAQLLFEDVAWLAAPDAAATAPDQPLFPEVVHDATGRALWEGQHEQTRRRFLAVAEAAPRIFDAGGLEVRRRARIPDAVVLDPSRLSGMAEQLLAVLGQGRTEGSWLTALELVARLPVLAARAGLVLVPTGEDVLLTPELVELLAPQVHLAYQEVSEETGNASGSPLALQLWAGLSEFEQASNRATIIGCAVAHAAQGLAWRRVTDQGGVDIEPHVESLGRLENRRWAIHERRHGRPDHTWARPWGDLGEALREYDFMIMRAVPAILADAGLEIYEVGRTGSSMT
ncbi:hypothetical protein EII34_09470 [Arachnia propionica]|uniref:Uncharacterized protein n=1 Tax=Arachnia propionica TaxID=1750 RepID=A0A3P1T4T4_9ACTN|nr:hypothetical protein [Arachnia propionica]RRD04527.1 hypothetical protein EII34_09470 [Arachnia propionica]